MLGIPTDTAVNLGEVAEYEKKKAAAPNTAAAAEIETVVPDIPFAACISVRAPRHRGVLLHRQFALPARSLGAAPPAPRHALAYSCNPY